MFFYWSVSRPDLFSLCEEIMIDSPLSFAPEYLLKPYSDLNKQTYRMLLSSYYRDGCRQSGIIYFYYKVRGRDLSVDDLSRDEALKLIRDNRFTAYMYRDVSRPDVYSFFTDIVFNEIIVRQGLYTSLSL